MTDELSEYTVTIGGLEHTMLLDDEHATSLGAKKKSTANKAKTPSNKATTSQAEKA